MTAFDKNLNIPLKLSERLTACNNLPSLPAIVIKIMDASQDPDIGIADVANILKVDPALSAKLLKVANSPMYARQREISNLRDALSLLGLDSSLTIALSFSLVSSLQSSTNATHIYDAFWRRSILSASIARELGIALKRSNVEDFFLTSLLQDIGILAVDSIEPDALTENCNRNHQSRITCEQKKWGVDHSDIGAWLLQLWHFPERIYNAVLHSHVTCNIPPKSNSILFIQCINLSNRLCDIWLEDDREPHLKDTFNSLNQLFDFDQASFNQLINKVDALLPEMSRLFEVTLLDNKDREDVLNDAQQILMENSINIIKKNVECQNQIRTLTEQAKNCEDASNKDHLTDVYNRKRIEDLLNEEFFKSKAQKMPLSLAFIDIDDFKPINDTFGHLAGDKVLREIAAFFAHNIRKHDIIARYGGDEFLLMLPNTNADEATQLLNRISQELQALPGTEFDNNILKVSTSIGMATHMEKVNYGSPKDLINSADKALYSSKKSGKNKITCL
jgi:diguanylate cyclase (GGDEF)-like protein